VVSDRRATQPLVWVDCEMTGLDLARDAMIEIAVVVTDADLRPLAPGLDIVIHAADDLLDAMVPVVQEMHAASGLTDEVRRSTVTVAEAEAQVLAHIKQFAPEPNTAPLCGNSIGTDRSFITRDMPALDHHLHYRMVDVSSIKELARRWFPRIYFGQPAKGLAHRALADILESIEELAYYRQTMFVSPPGPSTSEIEAAAAPADVIAAPADVIAAPADVIAAPAHVTAAPADIVPIASASAVPTQPVD
jgi:oligoribonuclease